jgi:hypothetical protein
LVTAIFECRFSTFEPPNILGLSMNKNFVAAAAAFVLLGAASAASATTFAGTWGATYNTSDNGLPIVVNNDSHSPASGNFSFNLSNVNTSTSVNLFNISTSSDDLEHNDDNGKVFGLTFTFTAPSNASGTVDGETSGVSVPVFFNSHYEEGVLDWDNGGNTTVNFAGGGQLLIHLDDVVFNKGSSGHDPDLGDNAGVVKASFTLKQAVPGGVAGAVPEPMSWALMLMGFGGLGAALRFNRRQGAALTAA